VKPGSRNAISLHKFWDDLIIGSQRFQTVRNRATLIRQQHPADEFKAVGRDETGFRAVVEG
jgi:hypothetical protein